MPIEDLENIVKQLKDGMGDFVDPSFNFIYTAHYNEVILYPHFEQMVEIFKKYGFKTMVLTNGVGLTPKKIDFIKEHQDTVVGICLNIPAAEPELWGRFTGMNPKVFNKVMDNVRYAVESLPNMVAWKSLSIQVNGMSERSQVSNGGVMQLLTSAPEIDLSIGTGDLDRTLTLFRERFPGVHVYANEGLVDRAGYLDQAGIMTNAYAISTYNKKDKSTVVGCSNMGGRDKSWLHVNANGDVFICCNDYDFDTVFGNTNTTPIKDIWMSQSHKDMISKSYTSLCMTCTHAIWK